MQTNYISVSAKREQRCDDWQLAATVMKQQIMQLYHSGILPADRVASLFEEHPELRRA